MSDRAITAERPPDRLDSPTGRPRGKVKLGAVVCMRLTDDLADQLKRRARAAGTSAADFLRNLLVEVLKRGP